MTDSQTADGATIDRTRLLIIGAGPGVGGGLPRRFGRGGYHLTLLARSSDGVAALADGFADTGAVIDTLTADAGDPEGLRAALTSLYARADAPGLVIYNAAL